MQFLIDENCPKRLVSLLEQAGYHAIHVADAGLAGTKDPDLFLWACQYQYIIVSRDLGWADVRRYPPRTHPGLVILRVSYTATITEITHTFQQFVVQIPKIEQLTGALVIVEDQKIRFRIS